MLSGHLKNVLSSSMRNCRLSGGLISKGFRVLSGYVPHYYSYSCDDSSDDDSDEDTAFISRTE